MNANEFDVEAFDAFEAAGWEERAAAYHDFFGPLTTRVVDALLDACHVQRTSRVLDVATGPGYLAAACAAKGATVVGVDVAREMVALARGLFPDVEFRQTDVRKLPFEDGSFDAVAGNFAILHFAHPERAVAELARVLAPGGWVALSTWDAPDACRLVGVLVDAVTEVGVSPPPDVPPGPSFFRFSSEPTFADLLAGAALAEIRVETVSFTHRLPSPAALWDGLLDGTVRTRALVFGQPAPTQRRIRAAFDRLISEYVTDGGLEIPVSVKVASARKPVK